MLARNPSKRIVIAQCICCSGAGVLCWLEDRPVCRACMGSGCMDLLVADETEDVLWDEAVTMVELFGLERDPEAHAYRWRNGRWEVVDYEQSMRGGVH